VNSAGATLYEFSTLALLVVFSAVLFSRLRAARYGLPVSLLIAVLGVAQPAYLYSAKGFHSALFTISIYAMCAAATAFACKQDARRIVLLGGSLAGAQLIHPICGAAATIALPVALRRSMVTNYARGTAGIVISVLFIPVSVAMGSLYLLSEKAWLFRWPSSNASAGQPLAVAAIGAAFGIVPLLVILRFCPAGSRTIIGVIGIIAAGASFVSAVIGGREYALQSSAAAGSLLVYLISEWAPDTKRARLAVGAALPTFAIAWLFAFTLVGISA
jgi:hypothetical protein